MKIVADLAGVTFKEDQSTPTTSLLLTGQTLNIRNSLFQGLNTGANGTLSLANTSASFSNVTFQQTNGSFAGGIYATPNSTVSVMNCRCAVNVVCSDHHVSWAGLDIMWMFQWCSMFSSAMIPCLAACQQSSTLDAYEYEAQQSWLSLLRVLLHCHPHLLIGLMAVIFHAHCIRRLLTLDGKHLSTVSRPFTSARASTSLKGWHHSPGCCIHTSAGIRACELQAHLSCALTIPLCITKHQHHGCNLFTSGGPESVNPRHI